MPTFWWQLTLEAPSEQVETLSDQLSALGALSVTWMDAGDSPVYEPEKPDTPVWPKVHVTGLFDAETDMASVKSALPQVDILNLAQLPEQDWVRAWMSDFQPMQFGERLWVCPSWCEPPDPDACNLLLDPGLAFGTGTHATTALCLTWLAQHDVAGKMVLDYGCGSGILAIAAAKLGAARVLAVDHDAQALQATRENAKNNAVNVETMFPAQLPDIQADILLANILAQPLIELSTKLTAHVKRDGDIVLSGILQEQANSVRQAYAEAFDLEPTATQEDWTRLAGQRR